jgi:glutamate synthase domain-containing protein 2
MSLGLLTPEFTIIRDDERCIACQVCVRQCANDVHDYDPEDDWVYSDYSRCVGCHRCVTLCLTRALTVVRNPPDFRPNANWTPQMITGIFRQAETGGVLLTGMGCAQSYRIYFDHLLLNASQVTNPSINPLREPMELHTTIGRKPDRLEVTRERGGVKIETQLAPQITLETPIMFSAMSYGSISYNACVSLARAAKQCGLVYNTGEGGLHPALYEYGPYTIAQVASGRFGVHSEYLEVAAALEIKIGQGAKPGIPALCAALVTSLRAAVCLLTPVSSSAPPTGKMTSATPPPVALRTRRPRSARRRACASYASPWHRSTSPLATWRITSPRF